MLVLVLFCCGVLAGITTLLFGFGGGFIVVPIVYLTIQYITPYTSSAHHAAMHIAVATSLLVMIFNASFATYKQAQQGHLNTEYLWPLTLFIGMGAALGVLLSLQLSSDVLKILFVIYLAITILETIYRTRHFSQQLHQPRLLKLMENTLGGLIIGAIAAMLGVGGSVMTVPLFRRCGLTMRHATALANPLSLPVSIMGVVSFILAAMDNSPHLGTWYIGYFFWPAVISLILGAIAGMRLAMPWVKRISEKLHEQAYIMLLCMVLLSLLLR